MSLNRTEYLFILLAIEYSHQKWHNPLHLNINLPYKYFGFPDSFEAFQSKPSEARKWRQTVVGATKLKSNLPRVTKTFHWIHIKTMQKEYF